MHVCDHGDRDCDDGGGGDYYSYSMTSMHVWRVPLDLDLADPIEHVSRAQLGVS